MSDLQRVAQLAQQIEEMGGKCSEPQALPDGSGFFTASFPLPKNHWIYAEHDNVPPMGLRCGTVHPLHNELSEKVCAAARYAIRCSTMNGREDDFDPDALERNMLVGLLGYATPDGLSSDAEANPVPAPPAVGAVPGSTALERALTRINELQLELARASFDGAEQPEEAPPPSESAIVHMLLDAFSRSSVEQWRPEHSKLLFALQRRCPATLMASERKR
jgi:hypothetical protein